MFSWASQQLDKLSQTVAPPPSGGEGKFLYHVQKGDEQGAMRCAAEFDSANTVLNANKGLYAIHIACQSAMTELVRQLLCQGGVNLHTVDVLGNTPLHHAASSSSYERSLACCKMLVGEFNASVISRNKVGQTPYDLASMDMVRQYLLPLQLQEETRQTLDSGGPLPPGTDLGGYRSPLQQNIGPPPGGMTPPVGPPVGAGPPIAAGPPVGAQPPQTRIASAPASMPIPEPPYSGNHDYARVGQSSAAIYKPKDSSNFVRPDGFHSSSSDVNLQNKYGHQKAKLASAVPPPPSSGGLPASGATNPYATGANPYAGRPSHRYLAYDAVTGQQMAPPPAMPMNRNESAPASLNSYLHSGNAPSFTMFNPGGSGNPSTSMFNPVSASSQQQPPSSGNLEQHTQMQMGATSQQTHNSSYMPAFQQSMSSVPSQSQQQPVSTNDVQSPAAMGYQNYANPSNVFATPSPMGSTSYQNSVQSNQLQQTDTSAGQPPIAGSSGSTPAVPSVGVTASPHTASASDLFSAPAAPVNSSPAVMPPSGGVVEGSSGTASCATELFAAPSGDGHKSSGVPAVQSSPSVFSSSGIAPGSAAVCSSAPELFAAQPNGAANAFAAPATAMMAPSSGGISGSALASPSAKELFSAPASGGVPRSTAEASSETEPFKVASNDVVTTFKAPHDSAKTFGSSPAQSSGTKLSPLSGGISSATGVGVPTVQSPAALTSPPSGGIAASAGIANTSTAAFSVSPNDAMNTFGAPAAPLSGNLQSSVGTASSATEIFSAPSNNGSNTFVTKTVSAEASTAMALGAASSINGHFSAPSNDAAKAFASPVAPAQGSPDGTGPSSGGVPGFTQTAYSATEIFSTQSATSAQMPPLMPVASVGSVSATELFSRLSNDPVKTFDVTAAPTSGGLNGPVAGISSAADLFSAPSNDAAKGFGTPAAATMSPTNDSKQGVLLNNSGSAAATFSAPSIESNENKVASNLSDGQTLSIAGHSEQHENQVSEETRSQSPSPLNSEGEMDEVPLSPEMEDVPLSADLDGAGQIQQQIETVKMETSKQEENQSSTFTSMTGPSPSNDMFAAIGMPPPPFSLKKSGN